MSDIRWILPPPVDGEAVRRLVRQMQLPPFVARLLARRGIRQPSDAERFLSPKLKMLSDPFLLDGMSQAVDRALQAVERGERIVLYGDYDVDGVTSLALLVRVLRACGGNPATFLPQRVEEGYGLSFDGIARCIETHHPQLLIAVDCGTSAAAEIASLGEQGVDVVVLDHHELKGERPRCVALVNPKLESNSEYRYFCSAGLAFKFAHGLLKRRPDTGFDLRDTLDLVALGTVADLVPLVDENRILVKHGLIQLAQSKWIGLGALAKASGCKAPLSPSDVSFKLGPRMNAAGRIGTAEAALDLLLTDELASAERIASELDAQNRERRTVEDAVVQEAESQLATWFDPEQHSAIVVGASGWHPGVVGIVASRLMKRYHRPTVVVGFDESGQGKGSGRGIDGFPLIQVLGVCSSHLDRYGGHEMASGVTLKQVAFDGFRTQFLAEASARLAGDQLLPSIRLDDEVRLADVGFRFLESHDEMQPFGMANPTPLLFARRVWPAEEPRVLKERHLQLVLRQDTRPVRAVWFGGNESPLPPPPWDVAFEIVRNEWQGNIYPQMHIRALRHSEE